MVLSKRYLSQKHGFLGRVVLVGLLTLTGSILHGVEGGDDSILEESMTRHALTNRATRVPIHHDKAIQLEQAEPHEAARDVLELIGAKLVDRMTTMFDKAHSAECRAKIAQHFGYFVNALGIEKSLPFADVTFTNECPVPPAFDFHHPQPGMHLGILQNKTYQTNDPTDYMEDAQNLTICYGILTHEHPRETIRLIQSLQDDGGSGSGANNTVFIVHVDGKSISDTTHATLTDYYATNPNVWILQDRVHINWGGFSMVNATLQMLVHAFEQHINFDKFVHLASTSYPIASNRKIRETIAKYPLDANLMHIVLKPSRPKAASWHYFVECDDALHRIHRLPPLQNETSNVELHTSSQWFTISREFAHYLAYPQPNTFVYEFMEYAQHVVVADETFFGTVLLHSPFCEKLHNWNFVHLQFDQWENQIPLEKRDARKCIMPNPEHCGRSPTTMTMDYVDLLELSDDLFARKFSDQEDAMVKDVLDMQREREERLWNKLDEQDSKVVDLSFEGHGVLIVAKETVGTPEPLCLGLGESKNYARLVPCFYEWVPQTLSEGWETGAVILEETLDHNRWTIESCTTDGHVERLPSAEMQMTPGTYSVTGPRCMIQQMDGLRAGRCLDGQSDGIEPGGPARVFPCIKRWPQFWAFGSPNAPTGSIHTVVPQHIVNRIQQSGRIDQESNLCLGIVGRGSKDEEHFQDLSPNFENENTDLSLWTNHQVVATQCSNEGAVMEWLFVPFILEDEDDDLQVEPTTQTECNGCSQESYHSNEF